jgi:alpha-L-rhamnosidase
MTMNKLLLLIFSLFVACSIEENGPTGLMVEFIREPEQTLILDRNPEFSWVVPVEAVFQTAFQIQIASSKSLLQKNETDIWDSNKIIDDNSIEISYAGDQLSDNEIYYWRVRIWDQKNDPTPFSDIQPFRTGKLEDYASSNNRFISKLIEPEKLIKNSDNNYFIDFGKDAFGTLLFQNIKSNSSDTIIVHLGEKAKGNRVDRDPGGSIRYQKVELVLDPDKEEYEIKLPANKRNTSGAAIKLPDSLGVIMPFRYCEIEDFHEELLKESIQQKTYAYYFDDRESYFESSDSILDQVWELCKYSIKATSFTGLYVDGDRERIPYEADAYINQLGHYYTDREYSMARLTNEYFIDHPTWPTEWILHTVPMFYLDYMFTGNSESLKQYYDKLKQKTLLSLARPDGLISSKNLSSEIMKELGFTDPDARLKDIVDWPPGQKNTGWQLATAEGERDGYEMVEINTVVNAFHYQNLKQMAAIAGVLNKKEDSIFFLNRAKQVKNSINEILLDYKKGIYLDGEASTHSSLHANMFPLAFDLVPDDHKESVIKFIKTRGMACSVYGSQYLLEGLYKSGEASYAMSLLTATHDRSWWNMIRSGSTISMEAWDIKYKPNTDWNHAWGAVPANIIPSGVWGIIPLEPGYSKSRIKPQLAELKTSKIMVPTIRGSIKAEFRQVEGSYEFLIDLPGNMDCEFIYPIKGNSSIYLNDEKINNYKGVLNLFPGTNRISIKPI